MDFRYGAMLCLALGLVNLVLGAQPLTTLEYRITGTSLQVTPAAVAVPKGVAGSVMVSIMAGGSTNSESSAQLAKGAYVQATLRGPGIDQPHRLVAAPNGPLMLPVLNLSGDYRLDEIALVDEQTGKVRLEGSPTSVPVHVFEELLISTVTSRPLTLDEIREKGIAIDETNFRAVEFNVSFVLDGKTIPISFPVVSPQFKDSTEIIPAAEIEERLKQAAVINQRISSEVVQLPPELEVAGLNIQVQGINFQVVEDDGPRDLQLRIPPIPALMVIPGNIGYLHQFFSVQIFTQNGAPIGSGLSVDNLRAQLHLPPGPDGLLSVTHAQPGDDPLRFARVGPNLVVNSNLPVVLPGADGEAGTGDDVTRLQPSETGQAEFLVEGLQQGLWVMNLDLEADLHGLAAGVVKVKGKAAGSVLVRNPQFSIAFSHPRTVRVGEPYTASVTVLNTGITPANLVYVTLNRNSISGAVLAPDQAETVQLDTIVPGETATATFRMIAQRTGEITFSDLTTSEDSVVGRFRFSVGVDERGVPLSPDSIAMPDFVNYLPAEVVAAATRVLGQALSIATAGQLPPGITRIHNSIITRRVLDLAEAGQRVSYGDPLSRVLPDLLLDWQGGRQPNAAFDELLRESDAGADWTIALYAAMGNADSLSGIERLISRGSDFAGLGQEFALAAAGSGTLRIDFAGTTNAAVHTFSSQSYARVFDGDTGPWAFTPPLSNTMFTWQFTNAPASGRMGVLIVTTNGRATQLSWQVPNPPATTLYHFALSETLPRIAVDADGDGVPDSFLNPTVTPVQEAPPAIIAVEQDLMVLAGRPGAACGGPPWRNYGTVVAVVFSKPITQSSAGATNAYVVEGGNGANSVQVQPSGRVALLNLRKGISAIRPRHLLVSGISDERGNSLAQLSLPIRSVHPTTGQPFTEGVSVVGRVLKGDGSAATGVPVTLTMYDKMYGPYGCEGFIRRVSQVITDANGDFDFDYVMAGIPYSISATDTTPLSADALRIIMESTIGERPDSQRLRELINASATPNSLLALLSAGSLPQAIAVVEGLDRALVRDFVALGSTREGQEVPLALRFRGRATVLGQVVAADGTTPVPNAAVNLYPDASSRELGRGIFADANGQFVFAGVPLGLFSIQVDTSDRRSATVLGLLDTPGQSTNVVIAIPSTILSYATLRGQVFDSDNATPVPNARVFLGKYDSGANTVKEVVRTAESDASGFWEATNVPIRTLDLVAINFDGTRKGVRTDINPSGDAPTFINITLEAATTVYGQVVYDDGRPATNALVAGGSALVRTDSRGNFQLEGVPVGRSTISAGVERDPAAGIDWPRLGSTPANIIAGAANHVVVKLRSSGRIFGKVYDAQGNIQRGIRVAIPVSGGFYWTDADAEGNYVFENLPLGEYTVSAPANAVAPQLNVAELGEQIRSGKEDQIMAAFKEAVRVFIGADDPIVNGEHYNFRPSFWGYTSAGIKFDGASANADVRFIPQGTVSGRVLNGQGVPIGARVMLTGIGPSLSGAPMQTVRGEANSDPATGQFIFRNQLLAGPWKLQAASPFYPTVISTNGFTTVLDPDALNLDLQFPPVREVNGRIAGRVFYPDGTVVGEGVKVRINISADYEIQTGTNGFFDTQTAFPALGRSYMVQAFDPATGLRGRAGISMTPGITNLVDVHLLTRNSQVEVEVLRADGRPATGAEVRLDHGSYPNEDPLFGFADTNGLVRFAGLWEGTYAATAQYTEASTRLVARGRATAGANEHARIHLRMGATGTIEGTFVRRDLTTPVIGAVVSIGNLGFASTGTNGFFRFDGVPIGTHNLSTSDPVTGANAFGTASINQNGQIQVVHLVEAELGTVSGFVLDSYGSGSVPGAKVTLQVVGPGSSTRTVTTGPGGGFVFPGTPLGSFNLLAEYALPGVVNRIISGRTTGVLTTRSNSVTVNIQLQQLTYLPVSVVTSDGRPATNTAVTLNAGGTTMRQDTSLQGAVLFANIPVPSTYTITAISKIAGQLHNGVTVSGTLTAVPTNQSVTITLPGVSSVAGTVLASDGVTPVQNAEISLQIQAPLFSRQVLTALSDSGGRFQIDDVPPGPFLVTAATLSLAAAANGVIEQAGQTNHVTLRLAESGSIVGRLVRANGSTPAAGQDVLITFRSQTSNAGRAVFRTLADGSFWFDNVPIGPVLLESAAPDFGGIINLEIGLAANGQVLDLGAIPFDEANPQVVSVDPPDTTIGVPTTVAVELLFSEALATNSVLPSGIFLRGTNGIVASTLQLQTDTNGVRRVVRITPATPLRSKNVYEVIALSGDLPGPNGQIIGIGPRDLVGRAMAAPFISRFVTRDDVPPQLLSIFPSNSAVQLDPKSVPRLAFDKTLAPAGFSFALYGPSGPVAGAASVGVNGQVLAFVPAVDLIPNRTYTVVVSNVFDLSGNRAAGEPFISTFHTLDTIGPRIASLAVVSNAVAVAGYTVPIRATLQADEPGASVWFTQDFQPIGRATNSPFIINVLVPTNGTTIIRAIAADQYGNDGQVAELTVTAQPNLPPALTLTRLSPTNGPALSGSPFVFDLAASVQGSITQLVAFVSGAVPGETFQTNGSRLLVSTLIPPTALSSETLEITAEAKDSLGRSSGVRIFRYNVQDATPPSLAVLSPPDNYALGLNEPLEISYTVSDNSTGAVVRLILEGTVQGIREEALTLEPNSLATNVFTLSLSNALAGGGSFTATVTATDGGTNLSTITRTYWLPGAPPAVTLSRVLPEVGPVPTGSNLVVDVVATSHASLSNIVVSAVGPGVNVNVSTNGPQLRLVIPVPPTAVADHDIVLRAVATDVAGRSSAPALLNVQVTDATPPVLAIISPAENVLLNPPAPVALQFRSADNSTNLQVALRVSGSITYTQNLALTLTTNKFSTNVVLIPLTNTPAGGGSVVVELVARDASTNQAALTRTFFLPGNAPTLQFTKISPEAGPVPSGSTVVVDVTASALGVLSSFTAAIEPAAWRTTVTSNGPTLRVQTVVPATALAGEQLTISAVAVDGIGRSSGLQSLSLPVADATPPVLTVISPVPNTLLDLTRPLEIAVRVRDNSSNAALRLEVFGGLVSTQSIAATFTPNSLETVLFSVPVSGLPPGGGAVQARITASDPANNVGSALVVFWAPGPETIVYWNRQALGQTFTCPNSSRTYRWPNNNNWSQSEVWGDPCGLGTNILIEPSNWNTPEYPNADDRDVILSGTDMNLNVPVVLRSLVFGPGSTLDMQHNVSLRALLYDFQDDGFLKMHGCCSTPHLSLASGGTMMKTGGTNVFEIAPGIRLTASDATLAAYSGTLALPGADSSYTNGHFHLEAGSSIILSPASHAVNFSGTFTGEGDGPVVHRSGTLRSGAEGVTFEFEGTGFQWSGGDISAAAPFVNSGSMSINPAIGARLIGAMHNEGTVLHSGPGELDLYPGARFNNLASGTYDLAGPVRIVQNGCCALAEFNNYGRLVKSGSESNAVISAIFNNFGGLIEVQTGVLMLANSGSSSNGLFNISGGATLDLTGGKDPTWAGRIDGSGLGTVLLTNGTLRTGSELSLNFAGNMFQWRGGTIAGVVTNLDTVNPSGPNERIIAGQFANRGMVNYTSAGRLGMTASSRFFNLDDAVYQLASDSGIYRSSCCAAAIFQNRGLFLKEGTDGNSVISVDFSNEGGEIAVRTGTLTLANDGASRDGTIEVADGALLDLTGGSSPSWSGVLNGFGPGRTMVSSGSLLTPQGLVLNFADGAFHWSGGTINGVTTNASAVSISGTNQSFLRGDFHNHGTLRHSGTALLGMHSSSRLWNHPGGILDFETDAGFGISSCCTTPILYNSGLLRKSGGSGSSGLNGVSLRNLDGTIEVVRGKLLLNTDGQSSNATLRVAADAILDLTGGSRPVWAGTIQGTGQGRIELVSGELRATPHLVLDMPEGMFHWSGGLLSGAMSNANFLTLAGDGAAVGGTFRNHGVVRHLASAFAIRSGALVENMPSATYQFEAGGSIFVGSCCSEAVFRNYGTLLKTGVTNEMVISASFRNYGGIISSELGRLVLANDGVSSNGTFVVAQNSEIDLTGGRAPTWAGFMRGGGAGQVTLSGGTLNATPFLNLDFTNSAFRWSGGSLAGNATNLGVMIVAPTQQSVLAGTLVNSNLVRHVTGGALNFVAGRTLRNLPGATYRLEADSSIGVASCCAVPAFENYGLLHKAGGTNNTTISVSFNNRDGAVTVDMGRLTLGNSGTSVNGSFTVAAGASVDLTGGASPTWAGTLTGTGQGRIELTGGRLNSEGLVLNCAPGMFTWSGGTLAGTLTNLGELNLAAQNSGALAGAVYNQGVVRVNGPGNLNLNSGSTFRNLPGSELILADAGVVRSTCCGTPMFANAGTIRKTGSGVSTVAMPVRNEAGHFGVEAGTLSLNEGDLDLNGGSLAITISGRNAGEYGVLALGGKVTVSGRLVVVVDEAFLPNDGDSFEILTSANLTGTFADVVAPSGYAVSYTGTAVRVTYGGAGLRQPAAAGLLSASARSAGTLVLSAPAGSAVEVWATTNLVNPVWELVDSFSLTNSPAVWQDKHGLPRRQRFYLITPANR